MKKGNTALVIKQLIAQNERPQRDLNFSRRWRFKSRSSGLWHRVVIS